MLTPSIPRLCFHFCAAAVHQPERGGQGFGRGDMERHAECAGEERASAGKPATSVFLFPASSSPCVQLLFTSLRGSGRDLDAVIWNAMLSALGKNGWTRGAVYQLKRVGQGLGRSDMECHAECPGEERAGGWGRDRCINSCTLPTFLTSSSLSVQLLFTSLRGSGRDLDAVIWNAMLSALGKNKRVEEAKELFADMQENGPAPTVYSYSIMIDAYGKADRILDASTMFARMFSSGLRPSLVTFNSMLAAYRRAGMVNDAAALFRRMRAEGVPPSHVSYAILIHTHAQAGDLREATRLF
ncbi:unnamed protein product, partial [Closterium sp. NIES-65]